ncbi:hypothetical protein BZA70DRAFT_30190 [Myxozyma melibiosi]|uniref:Uncharacterized protein n=1 Tax=Myxozyma melibiosi TaxID=54550 RepID=A0ABR1FDJ9_9ASCO
MSVSAKTDPDRLSTDSPPFLALLRVFFAVVFFRKRRKSLSRFDEDLPFRDSENTFVQHLRAILLISTNRRCSPLSMDRPPVQILAIDRSSASGRHPGAARHHLLTPRVVMLTQPRGRERIHKWQGLFSIPRSITSSKFGIDRYYGLVSGS